MIAGAKSIQNTRTNVAVPYVDSGMTLRHCVKPTGVVPPTVTVVKTRIFVVRAYEKRSAYTTFVRYQEERRLSLSEAWALSLF